MHLCSLSLSLSLSSNGIKWFGIFIFNFRRNSVIHLNSLCSLTFSLTQSLYQDPGTVWGHQLVPSCHEDRGTKYGHFSPYHLSHWLSLPLILLPLILSYFGSSSSDSLILWFFWFSLRFFPTTALLPFQPFSFSASLCFHSFLQPLSPTLCFSSSQLLLSYRKTSDSPLTVLEPVSDKLSWQ